MTQENPNIDRFFKNSDLSLDEAQKLVKEGLKDTDYGEFFQEITQNESISKDKGEYSISVGNGTSGFGFRAGQGEATGYSFSNIFNKKSLENSIAEARKVLKSGASSNTDKHYGKTDITLYPYLNPAEGMSLEEKVAEIEKLEAYIKGLDSRVSNVTISYNAGVRDIHIITSEGKSLTDTNPTVFLGMNVTLKDKDGKTETGKYVLGGSFGCREVFNEATYKDAAQKAIKMADKLLVAEDAPAGTMDVVLSAGWPAVILHEAVGHGLEGDFNRKDISVYSGRLGDRLACDEVTIIDQGDMAGERGSLHFDDEGTATQKNVLVEKGVLKGYMQDRQNAFLMNDKLTGNGRRESYKHMPIPRMTNTYFSNGKHNPEDIIKSVKYGLYITEMGGGQVDITSGKFNMNATLAYIIRDGKICEPVKGATLVGDGLTALKSITMVGNDLKIAKASGSCGKNGQWAPVGIGQPTIRVSNMTIGGMKK